MVYVDRLLNYGMVLFGKKVKTCHLTADSLDELFRFAEKLELKPEYIHRSRKGVWHFDLIESKRNIALSMGAIEK